MKSGAALVASSRLFFSALRHDLFYGSKDGSWSVAVVACRQDATNSKLKQMHMEVECGIWTLDSTDASLDSPAALEELGLGSLDTIKCLSDVIPVEESTALATVGMSLKMLESLSCPTWRDLQKRKAELAEKLLRDLPSQSISKEDLVNYLARELLGSAAVLPIPFSFLSDGARIDS